MMPIVMLSARDSARQFDCDNGSILHCSQHPSLYRFVGGHAETSGHVGIIDEMTTCPSVMSQEKVVQLSSLLHVAPISYNLLSTTHFVLRHSPQHLFVIGFSSWPCFHETIITDEIFNVRESRKSYLQDDRLRYTLHAVF